MYGQGFTGEIQGALLKLNPRDHGDILDLFSTQRFIESDSGNYRAIEQAARNLGMVK